MIAELFFVFHFDAIAEHAREGTIKIESGNPLRGLFVSDHRGCLAFNLLDTTTATLNHEFNAVGCR